MASQADKGGRAVQPISLVSCFEVAGGGRTEWRRRRVGAIFLESFVVGAFRHVLHACACARAYLEVPARVYRARVRVCGMCAPVPLCLQGDKYSRRSCNQGKESAEISTS